MEDRLEIDPVRQAQPQGPASGFTCPECHGALWEDDAALLRFRCRVGHAYAPESLFAAHSEKLEDALWAGYRALEENAALARRLAAHARSRNMDELASRYDAKYKGELERARTLQEALESGARVVSRPSDE
jgi:two-component system, chemotaxis family, protein-glutamate methylesterase/glutaminase